MPFNAYTKVNLNSQTSSGGFSDFWQLPRRSGFQGSVRRVKNGIVLLFTEVIISLHHQLLTCNFFLDGR
jgi:hypothetical protein